MNTNTAITKTKFSYTTMLAISIIATTMLTILATAGHAQTPLTPAKNSFQKKWIKNEAYEMIWYAIRDTTKFEIGKVSTQIETDKKTITVVTQVNMNNMTIPWVDSTVANFSTLKPIYHASCNMQRDVALNFGKTVKGLYNDKIKKQSTIISESRRKHSTG